MKKILLAVGLAMALVGCDKSSDPKANNERTEPGAFGTPVSKVKPGVEFPGEYPGGTNVQNNQNSNAASAGPKTAPPFGTARANSGSYERTNANER